MEGVVAGIHEDAPLQVDHRVLHSALRGSLIDAITGKAELQIRRTQHAPGALMALGGHGFQIVGQLALIPHMVAGGQHVRAQVEDLLGDLRRHAKAAGGVLGIDDDQIDGVRLAHMADMLTDDPASRAAEDVADKENVQKTAPSF